MRKILLLGLGSSGQRFVRILRKLYGDEVQIYVLRRGKINIVISNDLQSSSSNDPCVYYKLTEVKNLAQLEGIFLDLIIISSISSSHFQDIKLIRQLEFRNILVEKPLLFSDNVEQSAQLVLNLLANHGCASGYFTRMHPMAYKLKSLIRTNTLGRPVVYRSWYGENIREMHPYEDFTKSYAANDEMGGGPLNTFSHDLDLLYFFFDGLHEPRYEQYKSNWSKINAQEIQTLRASGEIDGDNFLINATFDFVTWPKSHGGEMIFESGIVRWDWEKLTIEVLSMESGLETFDFASTAYSALMEEIILSLVNNDYNSIEFDASWRDFVRVGVMLSRYKELR